MKKRFFILRLGRPLSVEVYLGTKSDAKCGLSSHLPPLKQIFTLILEKRCKGGLFRCFSFQPLYHTIGRLHFEILIDITSIYTSKK